ncbi:MAG: hypothetical protein AAGG38_04240 [Planctomycetota bacterium]
MTDGYPDLELGSVFGLVLGRAVEDRYGEHDGLVHVWWRLVSEQEVWVRVYIDGVLTEVVTDPGQRDVWLVTDRTRACHVELCAVAVGETAWSAERWDVRERDRVGVVMLRDETFAVDARVRVELAGGVKVESAMWPGDAARSGFGGLFGLGGFGRDAASGLGLGRGELGHGPLGIDGEAWRWRSPALPDGAYAVGVSVRDAAGRRVSAALPPTVKSVENPPEPAESLRVLTDFTLTWI